MRTYIDTSSPRTLEDGSVVYPRVCAKCGGRGYLPGYEFSDGARCWGCMAQATAGYATQQELDRYEAGVARRAAAAQRRRDREDARRQAELDAWTAENADLAAALANYDGRNDFIIEMGARATNRPLTPAQAEAATKALAREAEWAEQREQIAASGVHVPSGKVEVTGTIATLKWQSSAYGDTLKMRVVTDEGWAVWGTVPRALEDPQKGDRVAFTATVEPSEEDKLFGYFKRPTKARSL